MSDLDPARAVAAFDSATAMVRATGRALRGREFPHLGRSRRDAVPVRLSALLPARIRRAAYALLGGTEGIPPDRLGDVDLDAAARWITEHYPADRYPGVVVGSSNGAAVHLCAMTGMPFLPQTLLVPVRWPDNDPDRPDLALRFGAAVAPPLLRRNPGVVLHHMHDGAQDRLMVDRMAYFRLKWRDLPPAYAQFVRERLDPDAPVVLLDDRSQWPVTRVADRHVFQTGARGGLSAAEYEHGSGRLAAFLRASGSSRDRFAAPATDETAPEAEWGFEPGLESDLHAAAGDRVVHTLRYDHPQDLSGPVATLARQRIRDGGGTGDQLLVESFAMLDPVAAERTGHVPFWTFFPVEEGVQAAEQHVRAAAAAGDPYTDADVLLFPNGVAGPGAVPPGEWARRLRPYLRGRLGFVPGTHRWPAHFDTLVRYGPALAAQPTEVPPASSAARTPVAEALAALTGRRPMLPAAAEG